MRETPSTTAEAATGGHSYVFRTALKGSRLDVLYQALPVLVDLYRSEEEDRKRGRPHRTPARVMTTPLRVMILWFPRPPIRLRG